MLSKNIQPHESFSEVETRNAPRRASVLGIVTLPTALAQESSSYFYVGGGFGQGRAETNDDRITRPLFGTGITATNITRDNHDTAYKLFGGYQFNRNFGLEGGDFNLGKFGYSAKTGPLGTFNGQVKIQGFNLNLVGTLPVTERFSVFARAGVQATKTGDTYSGSTPISGFNPSPSKREVNYKPGDCRGNKRTKALVACLQPDRRVDVEVTATK